jgi:hypothetical protein
LEPHIERRINSTNSFQNNFAKYETFFPSCHVEAEVKESGNEESEVEMADRASGLIHGGSFRSSK